MSDIVEGYAKVHAAYRTGTTGAHPVADLFPMLAADELADLAADIRERGLIHPIVLDAEGRILDGRNRLVACEIAEVQPEFVTYDGDDPDGYALAVNVQRRNLTKGQLAMVAAKARLVSNHSTRLVADQTGLKQSRIAYAATVLEYAPALADSVVSGALGLDAAYEQARQIKAAAEGEEAQLARLRDEDPELAAKVVEGELSLKGARAELDERRRVRQQEIDTARRVAASLVGDFQANVSTVVLGARHGETGLISKDMVTALRSALDLLEESL